MADVLDWASELRPSMRKLRQAMDGLLKGGRLAHAILRIQQDQSVLQKAISLQVRRDVCFSQAVSYISMSPSFNGYIFIIALYVLANVFSHRFALLAMEQRY